MSDKDCEVDAVPGAKGLCIAFGDAGSFCGVGCETADECPKGFTCEVLTVNGSETRQCMPTEGECPCTQKFKDKGYKTTCFVSNEFGRCPGQRTCDSMCDAPLPAPETCDGKDSDCSGEVDEDFSLTLPNWQVVTGVGMACGTAVRLEQLAGRPQAVPTYLHRRLQQS